MSITKNGYSTNNSKSSGVSIFRFVAKEGQIKFDIPIVLTVNVLVLVNGAELGIKSVLGYGTKEMMLKEALYKGDSVTLIG